MNIADNSDNIEILDILKKRIRVSAENLGGHVNLMEVCGTHTAAIVRYGLKKIIPSGIRLVSGPGCPVCISPVSFIDKIIALSRFPDTIITTFGDMLRVPGSSTSLEKAVAEGASVRMVYSPADALDIAAENPGKRVVFIGAGFETTAPAVAYTIKRARMEGVGNFTVLSGHRLIPPAMRGLLHDPETAIDGFICPGHVSAIIGSRPYEFIPHEYGIPCVITGFEPPDIMQAVYMLVDSISTRKSPRVEIQYSRTVRQEGNPKALSVMHEVFYKADSEWRGLGFIPESGLNIRKDYEEWDADKVFDIETDTDVKDTPCLCADILKGKKSPPECPFFAETCTPENPIGPCMVSLEGACASHYKYGDPPKK